MTPDNQVVATERNCALQGTIWLMAIIAVSSFPAHAEERLALMPATPINIGESIRIPRTSYEVVVGASQLAPDSGIPRGELVAALASWISSEFDLPTAVDLPRIVFASSDRLAMLRYGGIHSGAGPQHSEVVAVYKDESQTIYLPDKWTGSTPAEVSVLVHEMVHHLQNEAGQRFACAEERERAAYAAQQQWLAMFDRDLLQDFDIDAFTLLVRTNCGL